MFTQSKIAALILTTGLAFSTTVKAEEVSLERYVTSMVNQAMDAAQQEFNNNLRSAVLTVANNVSFNEDKAYVAKVTITDVKETKDKKPETAAE
ncbi:hypothetical protein [Paraglaciecola aestuariivivens]